ncbi:alcohol dehydrogenase catalytic domain-containing protein [Amycolatopsis jiangsuensis]|uniref:Propanol-preferring alcohol dehydrogenase n=1 Tax=Amycolatopsis jiangsuensis TaxID=1181879 RepID=A0A840J5H4_9PSEU|nr:alcohol dehydrogenase catalytic domain-containing protein [Amycolatopsis jiangsuensis]MBB4688969.1 propanol-preferring alcohol dehydrogenase [Amycolatopsis jiangsuensis]
MTTYRAFEVTGPRQFGLVERPLPEPGPGQVRVRVQACGICHTDVLAVERERRDAIVSGHEIAGVIDAVGAGVRAWRAGERVGVGFLGGHCGECDPCRRGDFVNCADQPRIGIDVDGGYAEYVLVRASGLARLPDGLSAVDAAPLMCAGITAYRPLEQGGLRPGSLVAIQGIGGLGHLGVQYAKALGYRVVAIARGTEKAELAQELGADDYLDSSAVDPGEALRERGGAALILATAASGTSMSPLVPGLAPRGQLVVVGAAPDPISVRTADLINGTVSVAGSKTGTAIEKEDCLAFSAARGVRPMVETVPWTQVPEAYERMLSGKARFRVVLDFTS